MQDVKIGDILLYADTKYVVYEISGGLLYVLDFITLKNSFCFTKDQGHYEICSKPDNVYWMFIQRRIINARWVMANRGYNDELA
jgi:hypothetical protein